MWYSIEYINVTSEDETDHESHLRGNNPKRCLLNYAFSSSIECYLGKRKLRSDGQMHIDKSNCHHDRIHIR